MNYCCKTEILEVFDEIEKHNIYQEHESCIAIDKTTLKKLKSKLLGEKE